MRNGSRDVFLLRIPNSEFRTSLDSTQMRRVAVLGSTGSIGRQTLDVIERHPEKLRLVGLAGRSRIDALAQQIATFHPPLVGVWEEERAKELARATGRPG